MRSSLRHAKSSRASAITAVTFALLLPASERLALAQEAPRRIVSNNLCSDQYLLALVEPERIAAVSALGHDPSMSELAGRAKAAGALADDSETVLALKPDLALNSSYGRSSALAFLKAHGIRTETTNETVALHEIPNEIRRVGRSVGAGEKAEALAKALENELAATKGRAQDLGLTALIYVHGGYAETAQSSLGAVLAHLGIRNAARISAAGYVSTSAEEIITVRPDLLIISGTSDANDQDAALLAHPALAAFYPPEKRIALPLTLTLCPGPPTLALLRLLSSRLSALSATGVHK